MIFYAITSELGRTCIVAFQKEPTPGKYNNCIVVDSEFHTRRIGEETDFSLDAKSWIYERLDDTPSGKPFNWTRPFFESLTNQIVANNIARGFRSEERHPLTACMLITTEVAELAEACRVDTAPSEHIPQFTAVEEELADILIRLLDTADEMGADLSGAVLAKIEYNASRPYKHGKNV